MCVCISSWGADGRSAASTGIVASPRAPAEEDLVALSVEEERSQLELVSLRGGLVEHLVWVRVGFYVQG